MIDRRAMLTGVAAVGAGATLAGPAAAGPARPASPFGKWDTDAHGLPCYVFTGDLPVKTRTPAGRLYPLEPDPVFLLGNYDLTLFVSASGRMQFISGERGWVKLNEPTATSPGHAAVVTVKRDGASRSYDLLGLGGILATDRQAIRSFGCGTAHLRMTAEPGLTIERILSVAPSTAKQRAQSAVVVTVRLTNSGRSPVDLDYGETLLSNPTLALNRATADGVRPVEFINEARPLPRGSGVICDARATARDPKLFTAIDVPNQYNLFPSSLVFASVTTAGSEVVDFEHRPADGGAVSLSARSRVRLAPGETRDIVLIIALKSPEAELAPLERFAADLRPSATGDWFRKEWAAVLAPFANVPDSTLRAELTWDGHALLAMATYAAYYGQTFIPQGMTYDYQLDLNAGPRDHLQHAMAAAYFAPELARSSILYTLCRMTIDGKIKFSVFGNGLTATSTWSPSDQPLFLFYALGEYLRITRDWSILEEVTPYLPREAHTTGTTLDKLRRAFVYLRDEVSTGPHGLVRLLTGDWNDQIYAGFPAGSYRETAESHMNAAMVMAVMPPLIEQLRAYGRRRSSEDAAIDQLTNDMKTYADRISQAMMRDMADRTFARRAWLAPGKAFGDEEMHLEPQAFLLQAPGFPIDRKRKLLREMRRQLMAGEALGPRQREKPPPDARMLPGTSENGGFWYSLAGLTIAGVATFDRTAALAMLDRMTFRSFSRAHPDYWVGQWTAPDTLNAEMVGDIGGLPRPMDDGLWCKTATYCAHAHAWPIYCYFRIRDAAR